MTLRQVVMFGDSTTQGTGPVGETSSVAQGGQGNWVEIVAERLSLLEGVGPLVSSGYRPVHLALLPAGDSEWSYAGSWTGVGAVGYDKAPYGHASTGNGSDRILTFTRPTQWRAAVGFTLYYVDLVTGGDWQYRVDGGTWTNMGQTLLGDNKLAKFYVASGPFSTVDVRCYNGSSNVLALPVGIEVFYQSPSTTTGLIVHNVACNGARLNNLLGSVNGDRLAFVDTVKLGTGAITNTPNAGVGIMHINDVSIGSSATWGVDLSNFYARVAPLGPVAFVNVWECLTSTYNQTQQTNYRAEMASKATSLGAQFYDFYAQWSALGFTGNTPVSTQFLVDAVHESQAGHLDIGERMYWFWRTKMLAVDAASTYPVKGQRAAVAYTDKRAAVSYGADVPVGVHA